MTGPRQADPGGTGPPRMPPFLRAYPVPEEPAHAVDRVVFPRPRPFVITAGRVRAQDPDIDLHTQVLTLPWPPGVGLRGTAMEPELLAILGLCADPVSVVEISARLHLHLGVTRVLVSDLRAAGCVEVFTGGEVDPTHDVDTILRVINGLRAFT